MVKNDLIVTSCFNEYYYDNALTSLYFAKENMNKDVGIITNLGISDLIRENDENIKLFIVDKNFSFINMYDLLSDYYNILYVNKNYLIMNNILNSCFNHYHSFFINNKKDRIILPQFEYFEKNNTMDIPLYDTNVFFFRRNDYVKSLFVIMNYITNNFDIFKVHYNLDDRDYNFDNVLSIAIHIISGFNNDKEIYSLPTKNYYLRNISYIRNFTNYNKIDILTRETEKNTKNLISSYIKNLNVFFCDDNFIDNDIKEEIILGNQNE